MNYYEIYDKQTGELLTRGTARECRYELGCASIKSFYTLISKEQRTGKGRYRVIKLKGGQTDYPVIREGE